MKRSWITLALLVLCVGVSTTAASTIFGTVYDNRRNALPNVAVELLDQYRAMKQHTMTDGVGRYTFEGIGDGEWYVRVLPFQYDLDEEVQNVQIYTISLVGNRPGYTSQMADFVLSPRKGTLAAARAEVVYAQEIPKTAKDAYDDALGFLKKGKDDEAIGKLEEAIKIFPDYFLANHQLGSLYYGKKDYEHAVPPLMKAAQINEKSGVTFFYLGYSLEKLNYHQTAIIALKVAAVAIPASPAVFTALGRAQRMQREYPDAEKSFLQAKKLQKTDNPELYKELAALYAEMRQFDKAVTNLEQMLKVGNFSDADVAKIKEQIRQWKKVTKT